jgi:type I restriction enzyme S subunit
VKASIKSGSHWRDVTLNDVCTRITDGAHLSPKSVEHGMPMASVKDLTSDGITIDSCRQIAREDYNELIRQDCQPLEGDVLIAKDGASALDTVCVVKKTLDVVLLSSVAILRPDKTKIFPSYLRYYLDSETTRSYMKSAFTTGAAIPRVVLKDFKLARIKLPPISIQRKIVAILSAYDDLIGNNLRRIKILEDLAQLVYSEWFVHFRYPEHMKFHVVESEAGPIPKGWEVKPFSEIAQFINGFAFTPRQWGSSGRPIIKIAELKNGVTSKTPFYGGHDIPLKYQVRNGDVLFSWSADLDVYVWGGGDGLLNQHLFNARPQGQNTKLFLFHSLKEHMQEFRDRSQGTTMRHIKRSALDQVAAVVPPSKEMRLFEELVAPFFEMVISLKSRNAELQRTRDLLLPRLISGEVDVTHMITY